MDPRLTLTGVDNIKRNFYSISLTTHLGTYMIIIDVHVISIHEHTEEEMIFRLVLHLLVLTLKIFTFHAFFISFDAIIYVNVDMTRSLNVSLSF